VVPDTARDTPLLAKLSMLDAVAFAVMMAWRVAGLAK